MSEKPRIDRSATRREAGVSVHFPGVRIENTTGGFRAAGPPGRPSEAPHKRSATILTSRVWTRIACGVAAAGARAERSNRDRFPETQFSTPWSLTHISGFGTRAGGATNRSQRHIHPIDRCHSPKLCTTLCPTQTPSFSKSVTGCQGRCFPGAWGYPGGIQHTQPNAVRMRMHCEPSRASETPAARARCYPYAARGAAPVQAACPRCRPCAPSSARVCASPCPSSHARVALPGPCHAPLSR